MSSKSPALIRAVNFLGKKIPETAMKHPALLAGGIGVGLGTANAKRNAHRVEHGIAQEYANMPRSKYAELDEFAERKMHLSTKVSFEKVSGDFSIANEASKGILSEGIGAIRRLLGFTAQNIKEKAINNPKREQIMSQVMQQDPDVMTAEEQSPGQMQQAFGTMARFAPELSTDPNAVTSFLRNAAMSGGALDYNTIKGLADAETSIQKARNEGAWGRRSF